MNTASGQVADPFVKLIEDMRNLDRLIKEIDDSIALARGLDRVEAQRSLDECRACIEVAQYWATKAIAAARRGTKANLPADPAP